MAPAPEPSAPPAPAAAPEAPQEPEPTPETQPEPAQPAATSPQPTHEQPVEMPGSGGMDIGPMSLQRCLDRAFAILKRNFGDLILVAAIVHVPMAVSLAVMMWGQYKMNPDLWALLSGDTGTLGDVWQGMASGDPDMLTPFLMGEQTFDVGTYALVILGQLLLYGVLWFTYPFLWGVATILTAQTHLGREPNPREAWRITRRNYWQLVAVGLIYGVAYTFGSGMCGIGLVFIMPLIIYLVPIVLFEGRGAMDGLRRCVSLVARDYMRIVGWYLASYGVVLGIQMGLAPGLDLVTRSALSIVFPEGSPIPTLIATSVRPLADMIYVPLLIVFRTLMYFDSRARHEAFDLQVKTPAAEGA
jgi:hypothetical protein